MTLPSAPFPDRLRFPDREWAQEPPEKHGLDSERLKAAAAEVFQVQKRYGFLVVKSGVIVHETYARDASATNPIFSLTKSFAAALFGVARTRGYVNEHDPVAEWLPVHHPDIAEDARIEHMLSMTASRAPAGSWFAYNSSSLLNSLPNVLWVATGKTPHACYEEFLRGPLQLDFDWPHNARGWCQIGSQGPLPVIRATHRDVARLGLLWLARGRWRDQQLIAPDFIDASIRAPFPQANAAYGYLWWLNNAQGTWRMPGGGSGSGPWLREAPSSVYLGMGARGKLLYVVPEHDLVVVTMGDTDGPQAGPFVDRIWRAIASFLPPTSVRDA
jgi:CubicO group peptidase (beta-lactamase class C family)